MELFLSTGKLTFDMLNRIHSYTNFFVPSLCLGEVGVGEEAGRGPGCDSEDSGPPVIDGRVSLEQGVV